MRIIAFFNNQGGVGNKTLSQPQSASIPNSQRHLCVSASESRLSSESSRRALHKRLRLLHRDLRLTQHSDRNHHPLALGQTSRVGGIVLASRRRRHRRTRDVAEVLFLFRPPLCF